MNNSIISSKKPTLVTPTIGMYMSLRKSLSQLPRLSIEFMNHNQGLQGERQNPTHSLYP